MIRELEQNFAVKPSMVEHRRDKNLFRWLRGFFPATKNDISDLKTKLQIIMSSQSELASAVRDATAQLQKISVESSATLQKVTDLQAIIDAGAAVSPELQEAFDELKTQIQKVDDLTPDLLAPRNP